MTEAELVYENKDLKEIVSNLSLESLRLKRELEISKESSSNWYKWYKQENDLLVIANKKTEDYKKAYDLLMEFFEEIPDDEKDRVHKQLQDLNL